MNSALLIFTILAIGIHIFIFYLETIAWVSALAQKTFGLTEQEAVQTKAMAANQGVYNLLLAIIALAGLGLFLWGSQYQGLVLILAGCGAMFGAALYLFFSSTKKRAAFKQGIFPFFAVVMACIILLHP